MRRLALIAAAPLVLALVLALTSVYRSGSGDGDGQAASALAPAAASTGAVAPGAAPAAAPAAPAGTLVLGGQAGEHAVGLAVQRAGAQRLELEATILGPDGEGVKGLGVVFASAGEERDARPCGRATYCAAISAGTPARVTVRIEGRGKSQAAFDIPQRWEPGGALVEQATRAFTSLRTLAYEELLSNGLGSTVRSTWRLAAPDRLAYEIASGPAAVVIGAKRWDRTADGDWIESPQDPLPVPEPPWTAAVENASIIGSATVDGRAAWVVSFLDRAGLPTWFTLWVDKMTNRTLELSMTTSAHFMRQTYTAFDEPLTIAPPS